MCLSGCTDPDTPSSGGAAVGCAGPAGDLKKNLQKCDGGTDIYAKAKAAIGGKDPGIELGTPAGGFDGHADLQNGKVVINKNSPKCTQMETLVFELANLSKKAEFERVTKEAKAGDLSREDYTRAMERIEYDNIQTTIKAVNACKKAWGCDRHTFDLEAFSGAKNFEDYYKNYLAKSHKDYYLSLIHISEPTRPY